MDIERMLARCQTQQWNVEDLDWSGRPRPMTRDEEMHIVQFFTDMAGVELFAGALFAHQCKVADQELLRQIFATFVADEERHSEVARLLADYYDVHHYRVYEPNPALASYKAHIVNAIQYLSPEVAAGFITAGELLLDVALLRSVDDYTNDAMSQRAMTLINRDEARHIAMDHYLMELYASPEYRRRAADRPRRPLSQHLRACVAFSGVLVGAGTVLKKVFFEPMALMDPSGERTRSALKRVQLLTKRTGIAQLPHCRFLNALDVVSHSPRLGRVLGHVTRRLSGDFPVEFSKPLFSAEELAHADSISIDDLANEALSLTRPSHTLVP